MRIGEKGEQEPTDQAAEFLERLHGAHLLLLLRRRASARTSARPGTMRGIC